MCNRRQAKGFTLIELLVVISIITLLMAILLPSLSHAIELSRRTKCSSNLRQIGIGMINYSLSMGGYFPDMPTIDAPPERDPDWQYSTSQIYNNSVYNSQSPDSVKHVGDKSDGRIGMGKLVPAFLEEREDIFYCPSDKLMSTDNVSTTFIENPEDPENPLPDDDGPRFRDPELGWKGTDLTAGAVYTSYDVRVPGANGDFGLGAYDLAKLCPSYPDFDGWLPSQDHGRGAPSMAYMADAFTKVRGVAEVGRGYYVHRYGYNVWSTGGDVRWVPDVYEEVWKSALPNSTNLLLISETIRVWDLFDGKQRIAPTGTPQAP